jgi:hypothetical protein
VLPYFLVKYNSGIWRGILYVWGRQKCVLGFGLEYLNKRGSFKDLGLDGRIILKGILQTREWCGFIWLRTMANGGLFEYGIETSGSMKCRELNWPKNYSLFKEDITLLN